MIDKDVHFNHFNKDRCLELMTELNKLRQQGKSFQDFDKTKDKELTHYLTLLYDDIFWKSRNEYLEIIENFLNKSIDVDEFIQKFDYLHGSNMKESDMRIENLENEIEVLLNPESRGFTEIISFLDAIIELFDPEITFDMNLKQPDLIGYGISEELLKLNLKNNFLPKIRKYCKKS